MRLLLLEMKRVIKSRMTLILFLIAVGLSVLISYQVISDAQYRYMDESGNLTTITGTEAIQARKEQMQPYEGAVTEEKLQEALKTFQGVYNEYGEDIPLDVYYDKLVPDSYFLDMISIVYARSGDMYDALSKLKPGDITDFYQQRPAILESELEEKYPGNADILQQAQKLDEKVKTPFVLIEGYTSDNSTNLGILLFLLVLICTMVVAPIFSADYQNGSDDILRCTKNGRVKLAIAKLCSSLLIILALFVVCMLVFVLSVNSAYGWDSMRTSMQMISVLSFAPLTMGQGQALMILAGLLALLSAACFILFCSAKSQHPTTTLIIATAFCIFPAILHMVGHGNIVDFLTCVLPTGGAGISRNFFNLLNQSVFLQIGPLNIWAPYLTIGAAIIEIPIFFMLSIRAYCRHQAA